MTLKACFLKGIEMVNIIVALVSVVVGWFLNEISKYFSYRQELRSARGIVLSFLYSLHTNFRLAHHIKKQISEVVSEESSSQISLQILRYQFGLLAEMKEDFFQAVIEVSKEDPVVSMDVFYKVYYIMSIVELFHEEGPEYWPSMEKLLVSPDVFDKLNSYILRLSRRHGLLTWYRMRRAMKTPFEPDDKVQQLLEEITSGT